MSSLFEYQNLMDNEELSAEEQLHTVGGKGGGSPALPAQHAHREIDSVQEGSKLFETAKGEKWGDYKLWTFKGGATFQITGFGCASWLGTKAPKEAKPPKANKK